MGAYRVELDGLRALSLITVILFHAGIPGFAGGYVAVDVFFTLSGFLIPSIVIRDMEKERFTLANFYERRIRRIAPALIFIVGCSVPIGMVLLTPPDLAQFGNSAIAATAMVSNVFFWSQTGYFGAEAEFMPMLHTWTLGVEEQFYLLFPLAFVVGWRFGWKWIWIGTIGISLVSLAAAELAVWQAKSAAFYLTPFRVWELGFGMLAALYRHHRPAQRDGLLEDFLAAAGLVLIFAPMFTYTADTPFPGLMALPPVVGSVMVILFTAPKGRVTWLLSTKPLVMAGAMSFSVYLWHQPIFAYTRVIFQAEPNNWIMIGLIALSFGLGYLSWEYVEKPFRDQKRFSRQQIFKLCAASVVGLIALGGAIQLNNGLQFRFDDKANDMYAVIESSPMRDECQSSFRTPKTPENVCHYFGEDVTFAVLGDSHAAEPAYALAKKLEPQGKGLYHFSFNVGLPAFTTPEYPIRHAWSNAALDFLVESQTVETVLLSYRHSGYINGQNLGHYPHQVKEIYLKELGDDWDKVADAYWQSFSYAVEKLLAAGKRVVIVLPVPELGRSIEMVVYRGDWQGDDVIGTSKAYYDARNAVFFEKLNNSPFVDQVILVDPTAFMCDADNCYAARAGEAYYYDDDHLSLRGASHLADAVLAAVQKD